MDIQYRPVRRKELTTLFDRFGEPFAYSAEIRPCIPQFWESWLHEGALMGSVYERFDADGRLKVVGLCTAVYIDDDFYAECLEAEQPSVREELYRRELTGQTVVLRGRAIESAHQGNGLNLFFLTAPVTDPNLTRQEMHDLNESWGEALYEYRACNLNSLTWECLSPEQRDLALNCGVKLHQDWDMYWQTQPYTPPSRQRPYLTSITRREARERYGTHIWYVFSHTAARFGFTAAQQELLRHALEGETDDELAESLHLSVSAVKKRWLAIYDRVAMIMPDLLPVDDADGARTARGAEKRRRLQNYLRLHPEELHPINAARR